MRELRAEIGEGLRFLFGHRPLRAAVLLVSATNLAFMAGEAVLVLFATDELGLGSRGYGLLLARWPSAGCRAACSRPGSVGACPLDR